MASIRAALLFRTRPSALPSPLPRGGPSIAPLLAATVPKSSCSDSDVDTDTDAAVSYEGRERMLAYGNVEQAEKIRRRMAILEQEAKELMEGFDKGAKEGNVKRQDIYYKSWKEVDDKIQLLELDPDEYDDEYGL
ncbi:hypothetical protein ABPG75_008573 [Micractinium tetrahymenae]